MAKKNPKRWGCPVAGRSGSASWKWERKDGETGATERYGWSKLNCMELLDTSFVAREQEKSVYPQGGALPGGYRAVLARVQRPDSSFERHLG